MKSANYENNVNNPHPNIPLNSPIIFPGVFYSFIDTLDPIYIVSPFKHSFVNRRFVELDMMMVGKKNKQVTHA